MHDNEHPSRIIIGLSKKEINPNPFLDLMKSIALNQPKVFTMNSTEAEITKLFSNSFLANRVAFFNEVDGFALANGLSSKILLMEFAQIQELEILTIIHHLVLADTAYLRILCKRLPA